MTDLMTRSDLIEVSNNSNRCEDCPDRNPEPPAKSECPDFDNSSGIPVCKRPDGMEQRLQSFIRPTNLGNTAVSSQVVPSFLSVNSEGSL